MQSKDGKIKPQCLNLTIVGLVSSAINAIIAYIAVYFFKPVWTKIVLYFSKNK